MFTNFDKVIIFSRVKAIIIILVQLTQLIFLFLVKHLLALTDHIREESSSFFHFSKLFLSKIMRRTLMCSNYCLQLI